MSFLFQPLIAIDFLHASFGSYLSVNGNGTRSEWLSLVIEVSERSFSPTKNTWMRSFCLRGIFLLFMSWHRKVLIYVFSKLYGSDGDCLKSCKNVKKLIKRLVLNFCKPNCPRHNQACWSSKQVPRSINFTLTKSLHWLGRFSATSLFKQWLNQFKSTTSTWASFVFRYCTSCQRSLITKTFGKMFLLA